MVSEIIGPHTDRNKKTFGLGINIIWESQWIVENFVIHDIHILIVERGKPTEHLI
jgi:hypothetical protein